MEDFFVNFVILSGIALTIFGFYDCYKAVKENEQCDKFCYPSVVLSHNTDYCICANNPNSVIWRKDIK